MLKGIIEPNRQAERSGWRKSHGDEIHDFYTSSSYYWSDQNKEDALGGLYNIARNRTA
jgi:hypothetical protein